MKNSQKGSATLWVVVIVLLVAAIGAYFIFSSGKGLCRITNGNVTTYGPCPENTGTQAIVQSEFDKVGQAMKDVEAQYLKNAPAGFLHPTAVPNGYKPQSDPVLFEKTAVHYFYTTNRGVPADKNLEFEESSNAFGMGDYAGYIQFVEAEKIMKLVKEFSYNGRAGKVYISSLNSSLELVYDDNGKVLTIHSSNDPSITADILISLLQAMKVTQ